MKINLIIILAISVIANAVPMVMHAGSDETSSAETDTNDNSYERNNDGDDDDDDAMAYERESNFTNSILTITENPLGSSNSTDGEQSFFDRLGSWFNSALESIKDMAGYVVNLIFPQEKIVTSTTMNWEEIGSTVELITKQPDGNETNGNKTARIISGDDLQVLLNRASEENEI